MLFCANFWDTCCILNEIVFKDLTVKTPWNNMVDLHVQKNGEFELHYFNSL